MIKREMYDPANKDHRQALRVFLTKGKWVKYFLIPEGCDNLPAKLMACTLMYLLAAEDGQDGNAADC